MSRDGFSLPELLLASVVLLIVAAIAAPRLAGVADRAALHQARIELLAALDAARGAAVRLGANVELRDDGVHRTVVPTMPPDTLPVWSGPAAASHGVSQTGLGAGISFGPAGLAIGASNRTIVLSRRGLATSVVISRLGRVR